MLSWGSGEWGRLGHGSSSNFKSPTLIESLQGKRVVKLSAGKTHSAALTADGHLYMWGKNDYFQLGFDSSGNYFGGSGFDAENFPRHVEHL
ncbi:MAG: hypothetical protein ACK41O_27665, partial [Runella zeae]